MQAQIRPAASSEFLQALERHHAGDFAGAQEGYRRSLVLAPEDGQAWSNLGGLFSMARNWTAAHHCFRRASRFEYSRFAAMDNLARSLVDRTMEDAAAAVGLRMIADRPDLPMGYLFLQLLYVRIHRLDKSRELLERASKLAPRDWTIHVLLARVLLKQGLMAAAVERAQTALQTTSDASEPLGIIGEALVLHGRVEEGLRCFRQAVSLAPDNHELGAAWLFHANFNEGGPDDLLQVHRMWASMHAPAGDTAPFDVVPDPDRPLRIGLVSGDFCFHSVAYFVAPLLERRDRARVEIVCYSNTRRTDANTDVLRGYADGWHDIRPLNDDQVTALIRHDRIDVLIDLAGHTSSGRLNVFARRPAPVQVTWLGYPNTTGMAAIPYRLTDGTADPVGMTERHHTETLIRLPRSFLCYRPVGVMPEPAAAASHPEGSVTFGSLNNISKITPQVMAVWGRILAAVPGSRLLLKSRCFNEDGTRDHYRDLIAQAGIDPDRLELLTHLPAEEHFSVYNRIDIGLDPFPYNGTTTTCEALWMGVPVVTLAGTVHRARVGASLLHSLGLDEYAAPDVETYVRTAVALAADRDRLSDLRRTLRERMAASPLCDETGFAREFEEVLRGLWRRWCTQQVDEGPPAAPTPVRA